MYLSLSVLQFLLLQKLIFGNVSCVFGESLASSVRRDIQLWRNKSSGGTVEKEEDEEGKSTATVANFAIKRQPIVAFPFTVTSRQFGLASPVGFIVGVTTVANIANIILYAIPIIIDVIIGIVIAVVLLYLKTVIIRLLAHFIKLEITRFKITSPFVIGSSLRKLYNSILGTKLRRLLRKVQTTLQDFGLLVPEQKLPFFNLFASQPTDWSHFIESDWPLTQIHLVRQKIAHLGRNVELIDKYLELLSTQNDDRLRRQYEEYLCLKGIIKCNRTLLKG